MEHNTNTTAHSGQGLGSIVANDSRNELPLNISRHFIAVDIPDMIKAIRRVCYLGMYLTDIDLTKDDRFHFMLLDSLASDLEKSECESLLEPPAIDTLTINDETCFHAAQVHKLLGYADIPFYSIKELQQEGKALKIPVGKQNIWYLTKSGLESVLLKKKDHPEFRSLSILLQ